MRYANDMLHAGRAYLELLRIPPESDLRHQVDSTLATLRELLAKETGLSAELTQQGYEAIVLMEQEGLL